MVCVCAMNRKVYSSGGETSLAFEGFFGGKLMSIYFLVKERKRTKALYPSIQAKFKQSRTKVRTNLRFCIYVIANRNFRWNVLCGLFENFHRVAHLSFVEIKSISDSKSVRTFAIVYNTIRENICYNIAQFVSCISTRVHAFLPTVHLVTRAKKKKEKEKKRRSNTRSETANFRVIING